MTYQFPRSPGTPFPPGEGPVEDELAARDRAHLEHAKHLKGTEDTDTDLEAPDKQKGDDQ